MYDRKTWFVITACSILLAVNWYYSTLNRKAIENANPQPPPAAVTTGASGTPEGSPATPLPAATEVKEVLHTIETDKVIFTFTNLGGGIRYADFKDQFKVGTKDQMVRVNGDMLPHFPIGAIETMDEGADTAAYEYDEASSIPNEKIVFIGTRPSGLKFRKSYSVIKDGKWWSPFMLDFDMQVENTTAQPIGLSNYGVFLGEATPLFDKEIIPTSYFWHDGGSIKLKDAGVFTGGMFSKSQTSIPDSLEKLEYAGVANQYFATVLRPKEVQAGTVVGRSRHAKVQGGTKDLSFVRAAVSLPAVTLAAQEKKAFDYTLFIGPRHNAMLRQMGNDWSDIMPYGMFWWVANPLNRLLNFIHHFIDSNETRPWSWGLTIILMTVLVRTCIWPLYAKSTRSMKRMSKLQPEMTKLKEKYADDPTRMNQEMMKLYRTYGVNPIGGCLPMLIQLPIFYGFFSVLKYAVELRGHGFLWVDDLSQPDSLWHPFGISINPLPIVMAITSFIQMSMTPKTGDKTQQNMMRLMPLMFVFFCYNFASALALYWTTTNIFSIVQTWITNKLPEPELKVRKAATATGPRKKSWLERKQEEFEQLQRLKQQGGQPQKPDDDSKKKRSPRTGG